MTACQTLAQSLSASPSATIYPTTQFSLPPSFHHEISDLSAYNRSFPSKIKCCVDRLSWLTRADKGGVTHGCGLSPFDPTATLAVHCGDGFDASFYLYQSTQLSR
jgi:hypothetical protein